MIGSKWVRMGSDCSRSVPACGPYKILRPLNIFEGHVADPKKSDWLKTGPSGIGLFPFGPRMRPIQNIKAPKFFEGHVADPKKRDWPKTGPNGTRLFPFGPRMKPIQNLTAPKYFLRSFCRCGKNLKGLILVQKNVIFSTQTLKVQEERP